MKKRYELHKGTYNPANGVYELHGKIKNTNWFMCLISNIKRKYFKHNTIVLTILY